MKYLGFILAIWLLLGFKLHAQESSDSTLFDGQMRYFLTFLPAGYDGSAPMPLVFNMHGSGSNAIQERAYTQMNTVADTAGFIVVYPDGINNGWNSFAFPAQSSADDVGFISHLIDGMATKYNIDLSMVYTCGMSNGGFMSYRLACELEDRIAAMASVTGLLDPNLNCNPNRPMPIMQIHGTADLTVAYDGGRGIGSVDSTIDFWLNEMNCSLTPTIDTLPDIAPNDGSRAVHFVYEPCDSGTSIELYKILNGAHTWPDAFIDIGVTNRDFNASATIWNFFKDYTHPGPAGFDSVFFNPVSSAIGELINPNMQVYPNPMTDVLLIEAIDMQQVTLYNMQGEMLMQQFADRGAKTISLQTDALSTGVYLVKIETSTGVSIKKVLK